MRKIKLRVSTFLLVVCILLTGCVVNSQQVSFAKFFAKETTAQSKQELARAVLSEAGIAEQYDLYLGNGLNLALSPEAGKNTKFVAWMESLLVQEAGWKYVESKYTAQLAANFSEAELRELLDLAKQPLMKKLLKAEAEAYSNTASERRRLLSKLWDRYNNGAFSPPPDVLK